MTPLERHTISEAFNPSADSEAWMAFIVLNHLYPSLTYLSYDGYHCHGLADYSFGIRWQGSTIKNVKTGEILFLTLDFESLTTQQITNTWADALKWTLTQH